MQMLFGCCGDSGEQESPDGQQNPNDSGLLGGSKGFASLLEKGAHFLDEAAHNVNKENKTLSTINENRSGANSPNLTGDPKGKHMIQQKSSSLLKSNRKLQQLKIDRDSSKENSREDAFRSRQTAYKSNAHQVCSPFPEPSPSSSSRTSQLPAPQLVLHSQQLEPILNYLKKQRNAQKYQDQCTTYLESPTASQTHKNKSDDNTDNANTRLPTNKKSFEQGLESSSISIASQLSYELQQNLTDVLHSSNSPIPTFGLASHNSSIVSTDDEYLSGVRTPGAALTSLSHDSIDSTSIWNKAAASASTEAQQLTNDGAALITSQENALPNNQSIGQVADPYATSSYATAEASGSFSVPQQPDVPNANSQVDIPSGGATFTPDPTDSAAAKKSKKIKVPSMLKGFLPKKKKDKSETTS